MIKVIKIKGCDDTTKIIIDLTEEELKFLEKLAKLSKENSSYSCQPIIEIMTAEEDKKEMEEYL